MPLATMASAMARTSAAVILPAKWFQLFQPMGGVVAKPLEGTGATALGPAMSPARAAAVGRAMQASAVARKRRDRGNGMGVAHGAKARIVNTTWRCTIRGRQQGSRPMPKKMKIDF